MEYLQAKYNDYFETVHKLHVLLSFLRNSNPLQQWNEIIQPIKLLDKKD